ncbi:MAG: DUF4845 domain-containing protein [Gammaproteobacteria bacterium]|nr:MAG: DUF4845 domain-containing protein [Gammaproteobacteria bacterium]
MIIHKQRGMSMWGMFGLAVILGFFIMLGIKLFPVYMDDFTITNALSGLAKQPGSADMTNAEILNAMGRRLEIDTVSGFNLKESMDFENRGRKRVVRIKYESVTPIFANISVLIEFDHKEEIGTFSG